MREIIKEFWNDFKGQIGFKIISVNIEPNISLGITNEGFKAILIDIPEELLNQDYKYSSFENIDLEINDNYKGLVLILKDEVFFDIYIDFIVNILEKIGHIKDPKTYLLEAVKFYNKWGVFFQKKKKKKINLKKLIGVIGELYFIYHYLEANNYTWNIIDCWEGPNMKSHDFILGDLDIEVKAKLQNSSVINISSLYQLENTCPLFLCIVTIEEIVTEEKMLGMDLMDLIEKINRLLVNKGFSNSDFIFKLLQLGINIYDNESKNRFKKIKFLIKEIVFYNVVENEFPRLLSDNLSKGLKNVKYDIKVDDINRFKINKEFLEYGTN